MAGEPLIVSIWKGRDREGYLCSGFLLTNQHILTVKHAFENWPAQAPIFVRLIDGVEGDVQARLLQRHSERDAAILQFDTAVNLAASPNLNTDGNRPYDGEGVTLRVIDPDNKGRSTLTNYSVGNFDHATGEYAISPTNAKGHSGGVVEVDGKIIGLLSRRKQSDPLCRAVAMHLLWPWIQTTLDISPVNYGTPLPPPAAVSPGYRALLDKVHKRIRDRLEHPGTDALTRSWGKDPLDGFDLGDPRSALKALLNGLHRATAACIPAWKRTSETGIADIKNDCRFLLSELVKLAVNPTSGNGGLGVVADGSPDHLYLVCRFGGTADVVYCALRDLPHVLNQHAQDLGVVGSNSVHLDDLLPSGEGEDKRQEILKKLWVMVMKEELPGRIDGIRFNQLIARINRHHERDGLRYLLVAQGPRNLCTGGDYRQWADELRLGLALREDGDCAYLLMDETDLIDTAYEYLKLLEGF